MLAISLAVLVLSCAGMTIRAHNNKGDDDSDPEDERGRSKSDNVPDALHITPSD